MESWIESQPFASTKRKRRPARIPIDKSLLPIISLFVKFKEVSHPPSSTNSTTLLITSRPDSLTDFFVPFQKQKTEFRGRRVSFSDRDTMTNAILIVLDLPGCFSLSLLLPNEISGDGLRRNLQQSTLALLFYSISSLFVHLFVAKKSLLATG